MFWREKKLIILAGSASTKSYKIQNPKSKIQNPKSKSFLSAAAGLHLLPPPPSPPFSVVPLNNDGATSMSPPFLPRPLRTARLYAANVAIEPRRPRVQKQQQPPLLVWHWHTIVFE